MYDPNNPYETAPPKIEVSFKQNRISTKKSGVGTVNAGGAVIIIIFVVLCLTIFGLLSFATAFADKKLADKNLSSLSQYYEADKKAEEKLAEICGAINQRLQDSPDVLFDTDFVASAISGISGEITPIQAISTIENIAIAAVFYRTELSGAAADSQVKFYLDSRIFFSYDMNAQEFSYEINQWKITAESQFDYDEKKLDVWDGIIDN